MLNFCNKYVAFSHHFSIAAQHATCYNVNTKGGVAHGVKELGERIRVARLSRNMTQAELAEEVGVKPSTIGMWENGLREPSLDTIEDLADVFNVPMNYLITGDDIRRAPDDMTKYDFARLEALHQNPRLGLLFDRCKNLPPEDIDFMERFVDRIMKERDGD